MGLSSNTKIFVIATAFLVSAFLIPRYSYASTFSQGDIDNDRCVNANDTALWMANFHATNGVGDINGDHIVDVKDLAYIAKDFGPCEQQNNPSLSTQSPFGIEYARGYRNIPFSPTALASFWSQTGAKWTKFNDVKWNDIEPTAPVNGAHTYSWTALDHDVSKQTGLAANDQPNWDSSFDMSMVLRAYSTWGQKSSPISNPFAGQGRAPKPEYLQAYHDWVRAVVERYDDDGFQDAPDLTRGISVYEIESEGSGDTGNLFYYATSADYIQQLKVAYAAVKEADPHARVMLNGLNLRDLFADGSDEAQLEARLATLNYQGSVFNAQPIYDAKQWLDDVISGGKGYYDVVENHELGTWRQTAFNYQWIKNRLQMFGVDTNKVQIWAGDALSAAAMVYLSGLEINPPFGNPLTVAGAPDNVLAKNLQLLSIMGNNNNTYYDLQCVFGLLGATSTSCKPSDSAYQSHITQDKTAYDTWYRKLQAEEVVKKFVHGTAAGYNVTEMGTLENWPNYSSFPELGFLDVNPTNPYLNGTPRPIFYTYALMTQKIGNMASITRMNTGRNDIYAYDVTLKSGSHVYVLWYDDLKNEFPTQASPTPTYPSTQFSFGTSAPSVHITPIITARGQTTPAPYDVAASGGNVSLTLTKTPVFLETN